MRLLIASDIHGSAYYCERLMKKYREVMPDKLLLLGDILYHGPRNDLPRDYSPKQVSAMLNEISGEIICVKGNCEAEVDGLMLDFPVTSESCIVYYERKMIFATHGHVYNKETPPKLHAGDVLLHGHTHVPVCERQPSGFTVLNPGSVSIPKDGSAHSFIIFENGVFTWFDLEKQADEAGYMKWKM